MAKLKILLLGSFQVIHDGESPTNFATDKVRALLAYLAVEAGRPHRREALMGMLWPEYSQDKARQSLRQALSKLRQTLNDNRKSEEEAFLLIGRETLRFNPQSAYWMDVAEFVSLSETCKEHRHRGQALCLPCLRRMERMVELYRGDFLDEFFLENSETFEEWAMLTREWLRREAVGALTQLARHAERRKDYSQAREYAWRQVKLEPWREEVHRQLMRLFALDGQRSAALTQYEARRQTLDEELGVEPAEETTRLYEQIRDEKIVGSAETNHTTTSPILNVSPTLTPFVGRDKELPELAERLAEPHCRLLSIIGPGGMGKTRLALRTAKEQVGLFADGVAFVPLAPVGSPALLAPAIANALGLSLQGRQKPEKQLLDHLRDKEILLVLDGFEHLLEGSPWLSDILSNAPKVILLVTSRERLSLQEEWVYVLEGLTYPDKATAAHENAETFSAVELFRQRARQADQRFALSEDVTPHVIRICELVEGMPLGVELAAAWTAAHSCETMARAIEGNLDALTAPLRNVPARQRSARATFEYSWTLLGDEDRRVFSELSVFRGGFSETAARQVVGITPERLTALINKSLVRKESPQRYGLHELLRQFALEKLAASGKENTLRDKHARYYAEFLFQRQETLQKRRGRQVLEEIELEMGNIHTAWQWAVDGGQWDNISRSLQGIAHYYLPRGPFQVGEALFEKAAGRLREGLAGQTQPGAEPQHLLARLLVTQARFRNRLSRYEQADESAQAAIRVAHAIDDEETEATAHIEWGESLWRQGMHESSREKLALALEKAKAIKRPDIEAESMRHTGNTYLMVGEFEPALSYYRQAAGLCREIGDHTGEAAALYNTAAISTNLGRYAEAQTYYKRTLSLYRETGERHEEATVFVNLGEVARLSGDFGEALSCYQQSLRGFREAGNRGGEAIAMLDLGMCLGYLGDYEQAEDYCNRSLRIRREAGDQRGETIVLAALGLLAHYRGDDKMALSHCRQALDLAEELGDRLRQSRTLTRMGHAWLGLAQTAPTTKRRGECLAQAADAYRRALEIRRETNQASLAVEVTAGLARVSLAEGNLARAQAQIEEILDFINTPGTESGPALAGATDPFEIYLTCYHVLHATHDPRAREVLQTAHELLQQLAATIDDESLRRTFFEAMSVRREIRATYAGLPSG